MKVMGLKQVIQRKIAGVYQRKLDEHEAKVVKNVLLNEDFIPVQNESPMKKEKIAFIVGSIERFSGGHTSVLRLGTEIEKHGKSVAYVSFKNQSYKDMRDSALCNLPDFKGKFFPLKNVNISDYDIVIATSWQSVYYAKQFHAYKMYFIQDFEPFFFKLNERYLLAKKTYELGFHIVSLGSWNIKQIEKFCSINNNLIMDYIDFPYEPKEYDGMNKDYMGLKGKRNIKLAIYSKEDGKRIPNLLQIMILKTSVELASKGISLEANFFGFNKHTKLLCGNNLGKLNQKQMKNLYSTSDFGLVASMTNISLVPYEMIAMGLPVIEFDEGSFPYFFEKDTALLVDFNYLTLASRIQECIENPEYVVTMANNASNMISKLSWEKSCIQFIDILNKI